MPLIVGPESPDTVSINGPCTYPAKPVVGVYVSPNVYVNKQPLKFFHEATPPDTVTGVPNNPLIPCVIPVAIRKVVPKINKTVRVNQLLPVVQGDVTMLTSFPGTDRLFVAPFQHPNLLVANKAT
jgi:hypothetical protein